MDLLKAQLERLQQQLSGLTSSQKMLAFCLVAIMAMTMIWWGRYAGQVEMEPLLNQSFSPEDIAQITGYLDGKGVRYTTTADRIMVPADEKFTLLAGLGYEHKLPQRTNAGFDEIVKQMTPWDPEDKTDRLWEEAKQRFLEAVLDKFPGVEEASVMIDPRDERRFDGHDVTPSAMVYITTQGSEDAPLNVRKIANSAAAVVAGAEAGLTRGRVTVVVDGATIPIADKDGEDTMPDGDSIVQAIRANEDMYRDKIMQQLGFINGLFVSVRVNLNTKKVETQETTFDPKTSAHLALSEEEKDNETTGGGGGGEPGAVGNVTTNGALSVGSPGASASNNTETETKTMYENAMGKRTQTTVQVPGEAPPVSASVRVPRAYFISVYKDTHGGTDPDPTQLDAQIKDELDRIRQDVKSCTGIATDDAVTVNWYSQAGALMAPGATATVSHASPIMSLLNAHAKDAGVVGLAVASLFMVMMMVRKAPGAAGVRMVGASQAPLQEENGQQFTQRLQGESGIAGEVGEGGKTLDGMELDDAAVKAHQVVEQVSNMVSEDPEAAATLIKRWMNRT
jgi:flagellar biosynthesis/type III secretory pathway M-ring protein FliF/YscJ